MEDKGSLLPLLKELSKILQCSKNFLNVLSFLHLLEIQTCIWYPPERSLKVASASLFFWPFSPPSFSIKCVQKTGFLQWNEMLLPRVLWLTWDLIYRKPGLLLSSLCKDHKYSRKRTKTATLLCDYYCTESSKTLHLLFILDIYRSS